MVCIGPAATITSFPDKALGSRIFKIKCSGLGFERTYRIHISLSLRNHRVLCRVLYLGNLVFFFGSQSLKLVASPPSKRTTLESFGGLIVAVVSGSATRNPKPKPLNP